MEVVGNGTYGQVYKVCGRIYLPFIIVIFLEDTWHLCRAEHTADDEPPAGASSTVRDDKNVVLVIVAAHDKFVSLLASAFPKGHKLLSQVSILKL